MHLRFVGFILMLSRIRLTSAWVQTGARSSLSMNPARSGVKHLRRFASAIKSTSVDLTSSYEEFRDLAAQIRRHDGIYYSDQEPELTDDEYDALVLREANICKQYPDFLKQLEIESGLGQEATRFGGRVGSLSSGEREEREHLRPMLSLDNVNNQEELLAWLERIRKKLIKENETKITLITEPKLDGVSLSCRYELSKSSKRNHQETGEVRRLDLSWAATRGDGRKGQDVTRAAVQAKLAPASIEWYSDVAEVRGEVVLLKSEFAQLAYNFSNARNAASGILMRKEDDEESLVLREKLRFYAYDFVGADEKALGNRECLSKLGFGLPEPHATTILRVHNETEWEEQHIQDLLNYHKDLEQWRDGKKSSLSWGDYDMDGAVHKVSEDFLKEKLGQSSRAPRWAVAHKFTPVVGVTKILDVVVQVGRTGALTPVAVLEPINLGGVLVQRATLHNFGHLQKVLQSTTSIPVNTSVMVRRAGEVIPQVLQLAESVKGPAGLDQISLLQPSQCPACGSPAMVDEVNETGTRESNGRVLRCGGSQWDCQPRASTSIAHAFSRDALDLKGLSQARIEQLLDAGIIRVPSDIITLAADSEKQERLALIDGWGEKSIANLAKTVNTLTARKVPLARFLYALGIRYVGLQSAGLIATLYGDVDSFFEDVDRAAISSEENEEDTFPRLREENDLTKGIGPSILASLLQFSKKTDLVDAAKALAGKLSLTIDDTAPVRTDGPLSGLSVVFTGSLAGLTRQEAKRMAKDMGAKSTPGSLSKSTGMVVAGNKSGSKLDKAEQLGVKVIGQEKFQEMFDDFLKTRSPFEGK